MRTRIILSALSALAMLAGCASDVGPTSSTLVEVDVDAMTNQTLYFAPEVSQIPFTEAALAARGVDQTETIPVRVEIFENTAVAWFAPDGEAIISRDTIVALWQVVPISDPTVAAPGDAPVQAPDLGTADILSDLDYVARFPGADLRIETQPSAAEKAILDFADRLGSPEEIPMLEELVTYHPGCA